MSARVVEREVCLRPETDGRAGWLEHRVPSNSPLHRGAASALLGELWLDEVRARAEMRRIDVLRRDARLP